MSGYHSSLAQSGPYTCAELAAERMAVAMLQFFADEEGVDNAYRPLNGAEIVQGHRQMPKAFGTWNPRERGRTVEDDVAKHSRIIVAAGAHRFDPDAGPEEVDLEFVVETAAGQGSQAERLATHEKRIAGVRGILSGAGREGSVALAQANAAEADWTWSGWRLSEGATIAFDERNTWSWSQMVTVTMVHGAAGAVALTEGALLFDGEMLIFADLQELIFES